MKLPENIVTVLLNEGCCHLYYAGLAQYTKCMVVDHAVFHLVSKPVATLATFSSVAKYVGGAYGLP